MPPPQLEAFLTAIFKAMTGALNMSDKCNVLAYFETLCGDTGETRKQAEIPSVSK